MALRPPAGRTIFDALCATSIGLTVAFTAAGMWLAVLLR